MFFHIYKKFFVSYVRRVFSHRINQFSFSIHFEFHLGNESRIEYTFESETRHRITTDFWLCTSRKVRKVNVNLGILKVNNSTDRKRLHTHTQFYKALLVRSGRFRFVAPKSEGTAVSAWVSFYFFLFRVFSKP